MVAKATIRKNSERRRVATVVSYSPMTDEEAWAFLSSSPARPAILATTRRDGRAHVAPVWYAVDGHTLVFNTGESTLKCRTLRRDPRLAMCVDDDSPPFSYVAIEGEAEISADPDDLRKWATILGGRYMGDDRAEEFGTRNAVPGELVVRVRPTRITAFRNVSD
jgi:PPOX class probable F420-dependent enzyme